MRALFSTAIKGFASVALATVATFGALAPAHADAFDVANAYYGGKYGVPDFKFKKSEFGSTNFGRLVHLGAEVVVEKIWGATVVYIPGKAQVLVFSSDTGSGAPAQDVPFSTDQTREHCGPGSWYVQIVGTNPENNVWCQPATLGGYATSTYAPALIGTIPAVPRSCTFDAGKDGFDKHTC